MAVCRPPPDAATPAVREVGAIVPDLLRSSSLEFRRPIGGGPWRGRREYGACGCDNRSMPKRAMFSRIGVAPSGSVGGQAHHQPTGPSGGEDLARTAATTQQHRRADALADDRRATVGTRPHHPVVIRAQKARISW